jgi:VCBS repeat-containing protein
MAKGGNGGGGGNPGGGGSGNVIEFVILGLADDIASDSGTSQTDDITNIGSGFTLTGTIDPSIWPFTLVINGVEYTITEANIDDVTGEWSFTYPGDPLSPGTITVEAYYTTTHPRSNKVQTTSATPYSFELDTTAPDAPAGLTETGGVLSGLAEAGSAIQVYQVTAEGSTLIGTTAADGSGAWSYDLADAEGSFTAVAVDTAGNASTTSNPIEVGGDTPNSPATIAGETTGGVTEDGTLTTGGTLIVTDPDTGESALAPASGPGAGGYGSFVINADGTWTYTLDNADPAVQALGDGDTLTDSIVVTSADGSAVTTITVTINGSNDVPVITGTSSGAVAEDGTVTATGALVATDPDAGESAFQDQSGTAGLYGSFSVTGTGSWAYSLDNADAAVQALGDGDTLTEFFVVISLDGSATTTVAITITGANDEATVTGDTVGAVTEDGTLTAFGILTVTDPDSGENQAQPVASGTLSAGGFGTYEVLADGTWRYTLDNSHAAVQALAAGETLTDTFTVTSADETASETVTVTINGADEAPPPPPSGESNPYDDPLYIDQWHLTMIGDIQTIWNEYTGSGVSVGIYDNGIEYTHPDLAANYDASKHVIVNDEVLDPAPSSVVTAEHGTAVAGVIAAVDNDIGGVGIAFGASITGVNIFGGPADINGADVSGFSQAVNQAWTFDIINNSWGTVPNFNNETAPSMLAALAGFETAVQTGRGRLGTIVIKAAGNDWDSSQGDFLNASRYTITVAAHDQDGDASWYTNRGANVLVSAPSSGSSADGDAGILTTDETGSEGYAAGDYTYGFGGTSSATPVVAGVVALMLDANPNLGWRDVQSILAYSATKIGDVPGATAPVPADSDGDGVADTTVDFPVEFFDWFYNSASEWNGGGLHFSEDYGFGGVDAYAAARMAEVWSLFGDAQVSTNELSFTGAMQTPGLAFDNQWVSASYTYAGPQMELEYVEVYVDFKAGGGLLDLYGNMEDVSIDIVSPSGTVVSLMQASNGYDSTNNYLNPFPDLESGGQVTWTYGVNALRGETVTGDWTVRIVDIDDTIFFDGGVLNAFLFTFYGAAPDDNDVYHYTYEMLTQGLYLDPSRVSLDDTAGSDDWFDFSASGGTIVSDLSAGGTTTLNGVTIIQTTGTTVIENAVSGDGNDTLIGNDADNQLHGMRGDDTLVGGTGDDQLWGGFGDDLFAFYAGDGQDVIWDFTAGPTSGDVIGLYGFGYSTFDGLTLSDLGADTLIDLSPDNASGDQITLMGVNLAQLDSFDFAFA